MSDAVAGRDLATAKAGAGVSRVLRPLLMAGGIAVILAGAARIWMGAGGSFSTDDAYVRAAKLAVATDVAGVVSAIYVHEGQHVSAGQLLFRLDPAPFRHAVDGARAVLDATAQRMEGAKRDYRRVLRDQAVKQAEQQADESDLARFSTLVKGGGVTRAEYDRARFRVAADQAANEALGEQARVQLAGLGNYPDVDVASTPEVREAAAKLAEAERQLAHTEVKAPFDGVVTSVDSVQPGQYLAAANPAFGLVSARDVWVEAFPKETQLTWAKPGDAVEVSVDTYPGRVWEGELQSISEASGSSFSVLPAQNASGNWVKVVQRIPIRVRLVMHEGDPVLRDGMSVDVTVVTGHKRSWRELF